MTMKKIFALAFCFVMSSFVLAGCSGKANLLRKKFYAGYKGQRNKS